MPAVWAYRLYAWLLTRMPREEGDWLHQTGEHPISQFLSYDKDTQQMVWTVNLLCTELETRLSPPLLETNTIDLHGCPISVERQTIRKVPGPEALIFQGREQCVQASGTLCHFPPGTASAAESARPLELPVSGLSPHG